MSVPTVAAVPPPSYSFFPTHDELKGISEKSFNGETTDYSYDMTLFGTNAKERGGTKDYQAWGTLAIGTKAPYKVLQHAVTYTPPRVVDKNGKLVPGKECDISDSIELVRSDPGVPDSSMHYIKHATHLTGYAFDIVITDYSTDQAAFTGTMTIGDNVYDWYGEYLTTKTVTQQFQRVEIAKPANLMGSMAELVGITPVAWKAKGDVKANEDAAQKYGDGLMNKVGSTVQGSFCSSC